MMNRSVWSVLAIGMALTAAGVVQVQTQPQKHTPRGQATVVPAADFRAVVATLGDQRNIDKVVKTVSTNGPAGNVSVAAVAYKAGPQNWDGTGNEHSMITEVFYVTKGSATFIFGGDLAGAKEFDNNSDSVKKVFGPGQGGKVSGHKTVTARVGDSVVLPPNTPHNIIEVTEDFEMVVVRIDPAKVLQID